ncbi:MAG: MFS transporter, partial [Pseudomonadota bacterium]
MQRANKRAIWGWYAFDWAAQPYHTLLVTFIFAPYFASAVVSDPVEGQALWGFMMGAVGICVLVLAPIFGAVADSSGPRKPWILFFVAMTAVGASALWWAEPGADAVWPILVAFALGLVSVELAQTFINAVLPTLGPRRDLGVIGGNAWALGYAGGVASLIVMLLLFAEGAGGKTLLGNAPALGLDPEAREGTRLVGPLTAAWLLAFALPYLIFTPDVERFARTTGAVRRGMRELFQTIRYLPETPSCFCVLGSWMFLRDGVGGVALPGERGGAQGFDGVELGEEAD